MTTDWAKEKEKDKRMMCALFAMQALLQRDASPYSCNETTLAKRAFVVADAMIAELETA